MRLLQNLTIMLLVALAVFIAIFSLWGAVNEENWNEFLQFLTVHRFSVCCYSMALICVAWILVLTAFQMEEDELVLSKGKGETIKVSKKAVTDMVKRICGEFSGVRQVQSEIEYRRSQLNISLRLKLKTSAPMQALVRDLTRALRERLNAMDLVTVGEVTVHVRSFTPGNKTPVVDLPTEKSRPTREMERETGFSDEDVADDVQTLIQKAKDASPVKTSEADEGDKPEPLEERQPETESFSANPTIASDTKESENDNSDTKEKGL